MRPLLRGRRNDGCAERSDGRAARQIELDPRAATLRRVEREHAAVRLRHGLHEREPRAVPAGRVEKNGSNTRDWMLGAMPGPLSCTETRRARRASARISSRRRLGGLNALLIRFVSAAVSAVRLPSSSTNAASPWMIRCAFGGFTASIASCAARQKRSATHTRTPRGARANASMSWISRSRWRSRSIPFFSSADSCSSRRARAALREVASVRPREWRANLMRGHLADRAQALVARYELLERARLGNVRQQDDLRGLLWRGARCERHTPASRVIQSPPASRVREHAACDREPRLAGDVAAEDSCDRFVSGCSRSRRRRRRPRAACRAASADARPCAPPSRGALASATRVFDSLLSSRHAAQRVIGVLQLARKQIERVERCSSSPRSVCSRVVSSGDCASLEERPEQDPSCPAPEAGNTRINGRGGRRGVKSLKRAKAKRQEFNSLEDRTCAALLRGSAAQLQKTRGVCDGAVGLLERRADQMFLDRPQVLAQINHRSG